MGLRVALTSSYQSGQNLAHISIQTRYHTWSCYLLQSNGELDQHLRNKKISQYQPLHCRMYSILRG